MVKVLVVGWDGASMKHLDRIETPYFDSLEFSGKLLPEKVYRGIPIDSGTAWTTITTGLEVQEHGFISLNNVVRSKKILSLTKAVTKDIPSRRIKTYAYYGPNKLLNLKDRTPRSTDIQYKRLWDYIDGKTLTLGVPLTYPAWEHNGIMLAGIPAPLEGDLPEAYPQKYNEYRKRYRGYYFLDKEGPLEDSSQPNLQEYKDNIYKYDEEAFKVVEELNEENDFELIFGVFPIIDDLLHALDEEEDWDEIEEAYKWIDERTEELVNRIEPEHVVIISDHGMMPVEDSYAIGHGEGLKMDHDSLNGIWASDTDLDLKEQKDVTPAILELFDKEFGHDKLEMKVPKKQKSDQDISKEDEEKVKEKLKGLGYME